MDDYSKSKYALLKKKYKVTKQQASALSLRLTEAETINKQLMTKLRRHTFELDCRMETHDKYTHIRVTF